MVNSTGRSSAAQCSAPVGAQCSKIVPVQRAPVRPANALGSASVGQTETISGQPFFSGPLLATLPATGYRDGQPKVSHS